MQLRDFLELLGKETGLNPEELEILAGFPPAPIQLPSSQDSLLSSLAIANGDSLLIRKQDKPAGAAQTPDAPRSADGAPASTSNGIDVGLWARSCLCYFQHAKPYQPVYCTSSHAGAKSL